MQVGVLGVDGDGVFRPNARHVPGGGVANCLVDRVHLLLGLLRREVVKEEVDVGRGKRIVVVVLAHRMLRRLHRVRDRCKTSLYGATRSDDVAPVHDLRVRALCEESPVLLELIQACDHSGIALRRLSAESGRTYVVGVLVEIEVVDDDTRTRLTNVVGGIEDVHEPNMGILETSVGLVGRPSVRSIASSSREGCRAWERTSEMPGPGGSAAIRERKACASGD